MFLIFTTVTLYFLIGALAVIWTSRYETFLLENKVSLVFTAGSPESFMFWPLDFYLVCLNSFYAFLITPVAQELAKIGNQK